MPTKKTKPRPKTRPKAKSKNNDAIILSTPQKRKDRFWEKVEKTDTCWLFAGALPANKYAPFSYKYTQMNAHRAVLLWETGEPKPGLFACHKCRNKHCVNPEHLYWGTCSENHQDKIRDGNCHLSNTHGEDRIGTKLSNNTVRHIWIDLIDNSRDLATIAQRYGTNIKVVSSIKAKKSWRYITDHLPPLPKTNDTSEWPPFNRKAREPLTNEQIRMICEMIDRRIALTKIAEHTACAPTTLRNIFYRERGHFPPPCIKRGFTAKHTKGRAEPLNWSQARN